MDSGSDDYTQTPPSTLKSRLKGFTTTFFSYIPFGTQTGSKKSKGKSSYSETDFTQKSTSAVTAEGTKSSFHPDDMEVFRHPMCLIRTEDGHKLKIDENTLEQINGIDWPMIIVAVVGLYRSGKSYLMNRLAGSKGFAVGGTTEPVTKGIWIWCVRHPNKTETVLMLIDTEGLGDIQKSDPNHDNKIFTLVTLLCNCLVYNIKGPFDRDAVSKLTFIAQMSQNIRFRETSSQENEYLNLILPEFVLCLRDFNLKMEKDGKTMTADQYLEGCLKDQKENDDIYNKSRECIRQYFKKRKCFTFPIPCLMDPETLSYKDLNPEFNEAIKQLTTYIFGLTPKDLLASKPITGRMFTTLASCYVSTINGGAVPDVDDAFLKTAKVENSKIKEIAVKTFRDDMDKIKPPMPSKDLKDIYTQSQRATLKYLRENVVLDKDGHCEQTAVIEMDTEWKLRKEDNNMKIRDMLDKRLQDEFNRLKEKISKNVFATTGGHKKFVLDVSRIKDNFMGAFPGYEEQMFATWIGFMETLKETESAIIDADEKLSRQEKEAERIRYENYIQKLNEDHEKRTKKLMEEHVKSWNKHIERVKQEREEWHEEAMKRFEELVNARLEKELAVKEIEKMKEEERKRKSRGVFARIFSAIINE